MPGKRELAARLLDLGPIGPLLRRLPTWRGVLVLNYHRVAASADKLLDRGVWSATPEALDRQMAFVRRHFEVVGPDDLADSRRARPGRAVMITFDDGYRDSHAVALPILRRHGLTATFFLATGFLDRPRLAWWDEIAWMVRASRRNELPAGDWLPAPLRFDEPHRELAVRTLLGLYKALPDERTEPFLNALAETTASGRGAAEAAREVWMTWDMARELRAAGMSLGGHTVSHPILARLSPQRQQAEIGGCRARFEAELGEPMTSFAYPSGKSGTFDQFTRDCLQQQGVRYAFSFAGGVCDPRRLDPFDIPRVHIGVGASLSRFQALLTLPRVFGG